MTKTKKDHQLLWRGKIWDAGGLGQGTLAVSKEEKKSKEYWELSSWWQAPRASQVPSVISFILLPPLQWQWKRKGLWLTSGKIVLRHNLCHPQIKFHLSYPGPSIEVHPVCHSYPQGGHVWKRKRKSTFSSTAWVQLFELTWKGKLRIVSSQIGLMCSLCMADSGHLIFLN